MRVAKSPSFVLCAYWRSCLPQCQHRNIDLLPERRGGARHFPGWLRREAASALKPEQLSACAPRRGLSLNRDSKLLYDDLFEKAGQY